MKKFTILINWKDKSSIIAATTSFIFKQEGNITYVDQHVDHEQEVFFMRLECTFENNSITTNELRQLFDVYVAQIFAMDWTIFDAEFLPKMALFV